jgi:hypothetical protein
MLFGEVMGGGVGASVPVEAKAPVVSAGALQNRLVGVPQRKGLAAELFSRALVLGILW